MEGAEEKRNNANENAPSADSGGERFDVLLASVREKAEEFPLSDEEIEAEVEAVKEESFKARMNNSAN